MRYLPKEHLPQYRGRGPCWHCGYACHSLEAAHVMARGMGAGKTLNLPINLCALGGPWDCACHVESHNGGRPHEEDLITAVARRMVLDAAFVRERLWRLIRAPKRCHPCPACWGAGSTLYQCLTRKVFRRQPCSLCAEGGILLPDGRPFVEVPRVFH